MFHVFGLGRISADCQDCRLSGRRSADWQNADGCSCTQLIQDSVQQTARSLTDTDLLRAAELTRGGLLTLNVFQLVYSMQMERTQPAVDDVDV